MSSSSYTDTAATDPFSPIVGTLAGTDPDANTSLTYGIEGGTAGDGTVTRSGSYGTLTLNSQTGEYIYIPNAAAINGLTANASERFVFTVSDGRLGGTSEWTIDLTSANDTAAIGDPTNRTVTEDLNVDSNGNLTATGTVAISDADRNQAAFSDVTAAQGNLGTLTLQTDGTYSYSVANSAVQSLGAGQTRMDSFTVAAVDGTSKQISFTINGANDAPTGNLTIAGNLTSGQELTASAAQVSDVDGLGAISYQWQQSSDGNSWSNIQGATSVKFTPGTAQVGQRLRVVGTYTDGGNTLEQVMSQTTAAIGRTEVQGTTNADVLVGTDADDQLSGLAGRDRLTGGAGNDVLIGGMDADILIGGTGSDRFVYNSFEERTDVITDFNRGQGDVLDLSGVFRNLGYGGTDPIAHGYLRLVRSGTADT